MTDLLLPAVVAYVICEWCLFFHDRKLHRRLRAHRKEIRDANNECETNIKVALTEMVKRRNEAPSTPMSAPTLLTHRDQQLADFVASSGYSAVKAPDGQACFTRTYGHC